MGKKGNKLSEQMPELPASEMKGMIV